MRPSMAFTWLCLLLASCKKDGEAEPPAGPKTVKCVPVQVAAVKEIIEVRGTVAPLPERDALVAPQVSGRILRVEVYEGDTVRAGQVVARVDDAPLIDAAQQAEAAVARARAEHQNAQTTLARLQRVFDHGIVARQEVDDASAREASAKAAEIETEAAARLVHRQIERCSVQSPLQGIVLKVMKKPGELVDGTPATPVVEVADTSELELVADVPAWDLVRLARESPAQVTIPALPEGKYLGSVSRVAPAVDRATGIGTVRIRIGQSGSTGPLVGTFGIARIDSGQSHQATLVPQASLRSVLGAEGEVVVCGADKVAHVRKVRPGPRRDDLVEVEGELAPSEEVAVEPVLGLDDGDAIEVKP